MNTQIKILHSSCCGKGSPIREQIEKVADAHNLKVQIEELSELKDTMVYGTMVFPSIVINGKVYSYRNHNSDEAILSMLQL